MPESTPSDLLSDAPVNRAPEGEGTSEPIGHGFDTGAGR